MKVLTVPPRRDLAVHFGEPKLGDSVELTGEEEAVRRALIAHAREKLGLELTSVFVERGGAYAEIVRRAETWDADVIVVGTHGRKGLARVVLGSVAERVARLAHCSVLAVRARAES